MDTHRSKHEFVCEWMERLQPFIRAFQSFGNICCRWCCSGCCCSGSWLLLSWHLKNSNDSISPKNSINLAATKAWMDYRFEGTRRMRQLRPTSMDKCQAGDTFTLINLLSFPENNRIESNRFQFRCRCRCPFHLTPNRETVKAMWHYRQHFSSVVTLGLEWHVCGHGYGFAIDDIQAWAPMTFGVLSFCFFFSSSCSCSLDNGC